MNWSKTLSHFRRWLKGGLWVKFYDEPWMQCTWLSTPYTGLISAPHSSFHRTLISIEAIEDYT